MRWEKRSDAIRIPAMRPLACGRTREHLWAGVANIAPRFWPRLRANRSLVCVAVTRIAKYIQDCKYVDTNRKMRVSQNGEMNIRTSLIEDIDAIAICSVLFQLWSAKRESSLTQAGERRLRIDIADENPRIGESNRIKKIHVTGSFLASTSTVN